MQSIMLHKQNYEEFEFSTFLVYYMFAVGVFNAIACMAVFLVACPAPLYTLDIFVFCFFLVFQIVC